MPRKPSANLPAPTDKTPRYEDLSPWQVEFGIRLALKGDKKSLSKEVQEDMATRLANARRDPTEPPEKITYSQIRTLKRRPDFQELVARMRSGGIEAARALYVNDLPFYLDLHKWGAEEAKKKGQLQMIPAFTQHAIKAVAPNEPVQTNVNVLISLGSRAQAMLDAEPIEVEAEPLPEAEDA